MTPEPTPLPDERLAELLADIAGKDWTGVIKPNGKGTGLVGRTAQRGMGEQGCIAVINSIPGGKERVAITKLIALAPQIAAELIEAREVIEDRGIAMTLAEERADTAEATLAAALLVVEALAEVSDSNLRRLESDLRKNGWPSQADKVQTVRKRLEDHIQAATLADLDPLLKPENPKNAS